MSNYLAIATVTAALTARMTSMAAGLNAVAGLAITTTRPDRAAADNRGPWINIFLYQAAPNAAYRNDDLPTRRSDGSLAQRPKAALILHYLISMAGDDAALDSHLLLGAVIRELHARPALSTKEVQDVKTARPSLALSNLDEQADSVRLTPQNLSVEELSKLWSTFFEIPYVLSVAYEASPILIETDDAPMQPLPVQRRNVYALPFRQPQVDAVVSDQGDAEPIFFDSVLLIRGKQLRGDATAVLMADGEHLPATTADITDTRIRLAIPPAAQAGVQALQVIQKTSIGTPPALHPWAESNVASFVLRPSIKGKVTKTTVPDPGGGADLPALKIGFDLVVGANQRFVLLLNSIATVDPAAYRFTAPARAANGKTVTVAIPGVVAGEYSVRVMIDGAESPLTYDEPSKKFLPTVVLP